MSVLFSKSNFGVSQIILKENSSSTATTKAVLEINGFLNNQLSKPIDNYHRDEWNLQKVVIPELITRLSNLEQEQNGEINKGSYQLVLIEDIRNYITKMANQKGKQLKFEEDCKQAEFNMQLFSEESLIMSFNGHIENQENKLQKYKSMDYFLNINYLALKEEKQIDQNISIPMITKDKNSFELAMKQIIQNLELEKYSNNVTEHNTNLFNFFQKYYPKIQMKDIQKKLGEVDYELQYENKTLRVGINYQNP